MVAIVWSKDYELGLAPMDETHREFVDLVNRISVAGDDGLLGGLDELLRHTVEHFAQEDRWMRESGFPPTQCHRTEHQRVLAVMGDVRGHVAAGDLALGRNLLAELPAWFDSHASTMDNALAWHIKSTGYLATAGVAPSAAAGTVGAAVGAAVGATDSG